MKSSRNKIIMPSLFFLLFSMSMAWGLNFAVNCPSTVAPNTAFQCTISMVDPPNAGLTGLSFTINPGVATVTGVTFAAGLTDVSLPTSTPPRYGFAAFSTPFTGTGTFATISLQTSTASAIQVTGIRATIPRSEALTASSLTFPASQVTMQTGATCTPAAATCSQAGVGCPGNTAIAQITCPAGQNCVAGACQVASPRQQLITEVNGLTEEEVPSTWTTAFISRMAGILRRVFGG